MRGRWMVVGVGAVTGLLLGSRAGAARLGVTASRSDTFFSVGGESPSCTALFATADDALPLHVVRIRATLPAGLSPDQVRFQWSSPKPAIGVLLADADLGPNEEQPAIRTACAELGNGCVLTEEQLQLYNQPSILWVAPGCEALPDDTRRPFGGGRVRIDVRALVGKRSRGKGTTTIGFGRLGGVTLFVADPGGPFRDGNRKRNGESVSLNPSFAVRVVGVGSGFPALQQVNIDPGGGDTATVRPPCRDDQTFTACTRAGEILYTAGGKQIALGTAVLADGSALCDKLTVNVRTTTIKPKLDVSLVPKRKSYIPGDATRGSVALRVRLHNASPRGGGGNILLLGTVLSCQTEVKVGKTTIEKTTQIDLQHCSATVNRGCQSDADCSQTSCDACQEGEVCLTADHCSANTLPPIGCAKDADCRPPRCPASLCSPSDTCVKVLPADQIFLGVGDDVDLIEAEVPVANILPAPARVTDTWTVHTFNAGDAGDTVKYQIAPRPGVNP